MKTVKFRPLAHDSPNPPDLSPGDFYRGFGSELHETFSLETRAKVKAPPWARTYTTCAIVPPVTSVTKAMIV